jgi:primosomal protein N' (replication factor Y)
LTYHERANLLICHHCNHRYPIPEICPNCGGKRIKYFGSGPQRIEELVHEFAPQARVLRWDADTARNRGGHEAILQEFANHNADVLVGTQMIAKGLDLPLVTLVGVVAADVGLYLPDFRSGERSFQLLTQVAGRAGRSRQGGRVVIQSYTPDHYVIQAAAQHDYIGFYQREVNYRQEYGYPPLRRMARMVYWEKNLEKAQAEAESMAAILRARLQEMRLGPEEASLIGPAPAFFARFRGYYRWQILLLTADPGAALRRLTVPFGWRVDVDPVTVL